MRGSEIDKGRVFFRNFDKCRSKRDGWASRSRVTTLSRPGLLLHLGKRGRGFLDVSQAGLARHSIGAASDDWAGLPVWRRWIRISQTIQATLGKCLAGRRSGRGDQLCAVLPSRSKIVESSAEITALIDLATTLQCVSFYGAAESSPVRGFLV